MSDAYNYGYIAESNNIYDILGTIITIGMTVFWIVWTFLFQYFYINYCMNALEEDFAKEKCWQMSGVTTQITVWMMMKIKINLLLPLCLLLSAPALAVDE